MSAKSLNNLTRGNWSPKTSIFWTSTMDKSIKDLENEFEKQAKFFI